MRVRAARIGRRERAGDFAAIGGIFGRGTKLLPRAAPPGGDAKFALRRRPGRAVITSHPLRQIDRLEYRMGDEDDGLAQLAPQIKQIVVEPEARDLVERRERLVQQQNIRIGNERARQRDPHLHAAGQFAGIGIGNSARPTWASASSMRLSASVAGACESFSGRRTFSRTLAHGISVGS